MRPYGFTGVFHFKKFNFMKYLLDCANDRAVHLEISKESDFLRLEINDRETKDYKEFYLPKVDVYNLIGVLHHIQKQFKLQDEWQQIKRK